MFSGPESAEPVSLSLARRSVLSLSLSHVEGANDYPVSVDGSLVVWDELDYVVVQLGHCLVECGEPGCACSRELCQVGVGYLAVADDSPGWHFGVRDIVSPEFVPRVGGGAVEDRACRNGRQAFPDEQPHQAALSDRACREVPAHADEPTLGGLMMDMIFDQQGDKHVRV
jgi:hypothetical protein